MEKAIFARRLFTIDDDASRTFELRIYPPVPDRIDYRCDYEILDAAQSLRKGYAIGVDSLQALMLAIRNASSDILTSDYAHAHRLYWYNQCEELGLIEP